MFFALTTIWKQLGARDWSKLGSGGSISGDKFSAVRGKSHTELFNREAKGTVF